MRRRTPYQGIEFTARDRPRALDEGRRVGLQIGIAGDFVSDIHRLVLLEMNWPLDTFDNLVSIIHCCYPI